MYTVFQQHTRYIIVIHHILNFLISHISRENEKKGGGEWRKQQSKVKMLNWKNVAAGDNLNM
jgi:hypothetical protein